MGEFVRVLSLFRQRSDDKKWIPTMLTDFALSCNMANDPSRQNRETDHGRCPVANGTDKNDVQGRDV